MNQAPHGGDLRKLAAICGLPPEHILDFSASINPYGPPEWLRPLVSRNVSALRHYPDPEATACREAAALRYHENPDGVLVGNGSTELLDLLLQSCEMQRVLLPVPCYSDYEAAATRANLPVTLFPLQPDQDFAVDWAELAQQLTPGTLLILGHPTNPTGLPAEAAAIRACAQQHPDCRFIIDEAFGDFVNGINSLTQDRPPNIAVLLSLTKMFSLPGLRLGCALADTAWCTNARARQMPWSVNTLAQAAITAALEDTAFVNTSRERIAAAREELVNALQSLPLHRIIPGQANFLLIQLPPEGPQAPQLAHTLLKQFGIAIRVCDNFRGLDPSWFRIAIRTPTENHRLLTTLSQTLPPLALQPSPLSRPSPLSPRPSIMFQGTSSNAGKSILTAALCRILLQDGVRVAPFKAQNMSLNSFVTRDGGEMGRAQVVQAQACRIEPDVRMNPVLLKPNSDTGSQVIVNGRPVGNMRVNEYIRYKPTAFKAIQKAYDSLAAEYDAIILEGAGSPGEVNLKAHDIVNMAMAQYAQAPVLLVGDIDRGGVFASFIGTMEVLTEAERNLVAGFVVNRFRGQESLLQDAFDYTFRHTGKPVLGTIPYLHNLNLPEEDSVSFKEQHRTQQQGNGDQMIEIAVIDLPHISNFTDLDALRIEPDVHLRTVRNPSELGAPHAIILPGSKNTLADLDWLKTTGLAAAICEQASNSRMEMIGICGGFQMLGRTVADPQHIETTSGEAAGLALLDVTTTMLPEQTLLRTTALHQPSGCEVTGYEIHHGQTTGNAISPLLTTQSGSTIGFLADNGRIWGTYLHGIFDADSFRRWCIDQIRERQGWQPIGRIVATYDIEAALDRLADAVRAKLDMNAIYRILRLS